jgi:hypothetical protein
VGDVRQPDLYLDHERIARCLNNDVISRIFGVGLGLVSLRSFSQDPRDTQHLDRAVNELDHVINGLRAIVCDLQDPSTKTPPWQR